MPAQYAQACPYRKSNTDRLYTVRGKTGTLPFRRICLTALIPLFCFPSFCSKQWRRQVPVAGIRKDHNNILTRILFALGDLEGGRNSGTRRNTGQDTFLPGNSGTGSESIFIGYADDLIINCGPGLSPESTAEELGSTAITFTWGSCSLR